jgi:alkylhydroperoxidase family enzyme
MNRRKTMTTTELPGVEVALKELAAFEQRYGYDADYVRNILKAVPDAMIPYGHLMELSKYVKDIPLDAYFAAKLVAVLQEDCGPCVQLCIRMAEEAGVSPATLQALLSNKPELLPEDAKLAYLFTRATLAHNPEADVLRESILDRWGMGALMSLSFGMIAARAFPMLRYSMGYGQSCTRVMVNGEAINPSH